MTRDAAYELLEFSEQLRWEDLSSDVRRKVIDHVTDCFGVIVAGAAAPLVAEIGEEVDAWACERRVCVPQVGTWTSAPAAALLSGTMARALDFDDVHEGAFVHPSAGVLPAALATVQLQPGISGGEFLTAVLAGLEWCVRLGLAPHAAPHESGSSHAFQAGLFGGTVTSGLLSGLRGGSLHDACGIAYGVVGGNLQALAEGSMSIRVQQGMMAMNAVLAASLARRGIGGPRQVLEGKYGYFNVFQEGAYDRSSLVEDLHTTFEFSGTSMKPYAASKPVHPAILAAHELRAAHAVPPEDIQRVTLEVNTFAMEIAGSPLAEKQRPTSTAEMHFSLPWAFATAYISGEGGPAQFSDVALTDEAVITLAQRVEVREDTQLQQEHAREMGPVNAIVETTQGEAHERLVSQVPGHPRSPMNLNQLRAKFTQCCAHGGMDSEATDRLFDELRSLDSCDDVGRWIQSL